ncbi:MAG: FAD-binding oxidoreductase [Phycisphaerae bacterium]
MTNAALQENEPAAALAALLRPDQLVLDPAELAVYDADGFTIARGTPRAVCFPETTAQVAAVIRELIRHDVQIVPRGSGTGLTGGCVAFESRGRGGVVISTVRLKRIISIDVANRVAHVEAGVLNTRLSEAIARTPGGERFHYAPDPSSQRASTIGGNAATNAGGIHTLKDFVTSNHVLGVEMVLPTGEVVTLGAAGDTGGCYESPLDLPGLLCGSEGTLGIITSLWVRLTPLPRAFRTLSAVFPTQGEACRCVSGVIAAGHLPTAMEMLDGNMVQLVNETFSLGLPASAQAFIVCEIDGIDALLDDQAEDIADIMRDNRAEQVQVSADATERAKLWKARKAAFGAIGRISPSYCTQDACVPRSKLAEVLEQASAIGRRFGLEINNIFHASDGNVHPIFLYDDRDEAQMANALQAAEEVLKMCIDLGGTVTGEHGVGVEKLHLMPYLFDRNTLGQFAAAKYAFDPEERINAGKLLPSEKVKVQMLKPGRKVPQ